MIGDITFSRRLGFMEEGRDVQDMMTINNAALDYVSVVGLYNRIYMILYVDTSTR